VSVAQLKTFAAVHAANRLARVVYETHRLLATAPNSEDSIEAIHQFRVSTRRFRAVLDTFRGVFPRRARRRIRQTIRDAFSVAGEARNRDITLALIAESKAPVPESLAPAVAAERALWEARLREVLRDWTRSDFSADWRRDLELP
jgi:CHAD domain-containing protein